MTRRAVMDWLLVLLDGLIIGLGLVALSAGWVWWREGAVTLYGLETPMFILSGLALFFGANMSRPARFYGRNPAFSVIELATEGEADRRTRMSVGVHVIFGGVWGLALTFLFDWLRR
ncbi:MAG TPA: hypothetical protein VNT75_30420 [Symbiobacteriaceae bacterium]|nr:hypothetical protein [Symbiobacteriaceae bacterium]